MASNKRKQDERHLKMLREMVSLPNNKQCFDCHQRGPTYINMTIGSYVCTSCSGILRGLNPPHRVKSISMASFSQDEMDFMKTHGNDFCRKVWLGLYDSRSMPEPDSREEQRVKDFMVQKYEKKRWYVAPTEGMKEEARHQNELALSNLTSKSTRPIKSMLGEGAPKLALHSNQANAVPPPISNTSRPAPAPQPVTVPVQSVTQQSPPQSQPTPAQPKQSATMDLLGDLGGDPFAGNTAPTTAPAQSSAISGGGFADFANFNAQPATNTPAFSTAPAGPPLQPMSTTANPTPQVPGNTGGFGVFGTAPSQPQQPAALSGGDRYAALADVFSSSPTGGGVTQPPANTGVQGGVNWSGGGGPINWGGPSQGSGTVNWDNPGMTPPTTGTGWGSSPSQSTASTGNAFTNSSTAASNPFGARPGAATQQPQGAANLFAGGGSAGGFAQFGQTNPTPQQQGGFAQFGMAPQPQGPTPQGAFGGMQNGGFGMMPPASTAPGGFGFQQGASGNAGAAAQFGKPAPAAGGFGGTAQQPFGGTGGAGWGAPPANPVGNPFLSAASQPVPPRSNATNPFL